MAPEDFRQIEKQKIVNIIRGKIKVVIARINHPLRVFPKEFSLGLVRFEEDKETKKTQGIISLFSGDSLKGDPDSFLKILMQIMRDYGLNNGEHDPIIEPKCHREACCFDEVMIYPSEIFSGLTFVSRKETVRRKQDSLSWEVKDTAPKLWDNITRFVSS